MADNNTGGGLFGGLKKLLFKEDETPADAPAIPPPLPADPQAQTPPPLPSYITHKSQDFGSAAAGTTDEQMRAKAYQLLESINQPGVDFLEVWNAAEENGGASGANIKMAFNALKYADKSLTKEKIITTGNYYAGELQKALDTDLARKAEQRRQLDTEKGQNRQNLTAAIADIDKQIAALQQALTDKRTQLAELDAGYEPKIAELERKMQSGKATISGLITQMRTMLAIVEKEL